MSGVDKVELKKRRNKVLEKWQAYKKNNTLFTPNDLRILKGQAQAYGVALR